MKTSQTTSSHSCPATRVGLPCYCTNIDVVTPVGPLRHFTYGGMVELLTALGDAASSAWSSLRQGVDFAVCGVEYKRTA